MCVHAASTRVSFEGSFDSAQSASRLSVLPQEGTRRNATLKLCS